MKRALWALVVFALVSMSFISCEKNNGTAENTNPVSAGESASAQTDSADPGLSDAEVGSTVQFGIYEQDGYEESTKEPIEWIVLAKEEGKILVIGKYALENKPFNEGDIRMTNFNSSDEIAVTWKDCSLRAWLNDAFLHTAFSEKEQARIAETEVSSEIKSESGTAVDCYVMDKIFVLSAEEAAKYFASNEERKCVTTPYVKKLGVSASSVKNSDGKYTNAWTLRTPGHVQGAYAKVTVDGGVWTYGDYVYVDGCIRPAMWINIGQ